MAEKSVIASISQAEQRPFKTPQLPALRAFASEPAQQKRRFFLLLYFQRVGSPSILGENVFQQLSLTSATQRRQGQQTCFGWHGCRPAPIRPTQWLTRANGDCFFCILGNGVLFVNGIIIPAWSKRAFLLSALRPSGRPKWVRAPARKKRLAANGKPNALLALPKGRKSPPGYYANSILEFLLERN